MRALDTVLRSQQGAAAAQQGGEAAAEATSELASFLRKTNRPLRQGALHCLELLAVQASPPLPAAAACWPSWLGPLLLLREREPSCGSGAAADIRVLSRGSPAAAAVSCDRPSF